MGSMFMDVSLDFREEGGLALELVSEGFDRSEGGRADVVFHAFDIVINHLVVETQEIEKIGEELMSAGDIFGESFPCGGEDETSIFFVIEEAFGIEALDHIGDAGLGNFQSLGNIDHPSVAFGVDQFEDALEIIFHGLRGDWSGGSLLRIGHRKWGKLGRENESVKKSPDWQLTEF